MSAASVLAPPQIEYPEDNGEPLSDNTLQFRWIMTIQGGLDAIFVQNPNVFVAGNLLRYPVEGDNKIRQAPDVMVAFGRPKGYRGSYRQWDERDHPSPLVRAGARTLVALCFNPHVQTLRTSAFHTRRCTSLRFSNP